MTTEAEAAPDILPYAGSAEAVASGDGTVGKKKRRRFRKRWLIVIAVFLLGGLIGLAVFARWRAAHRFDLALQRPAAAAAVWPDDQTWSWSFRLPHHLNKSEGISLDIRSKSSPLALGQTPAIVAPTIAMAAKDARQEFGSASLMRPAKWSPLRPPPTAEVTLKLVDLAEAGIASTTPGQDLRVIGTITLDGTQVRLPREGLTIPHGHFAGHAVRENGDWANNELYLMTFYVRGDDTEVRYDVFLQRKSAGLGH